jgi:glutathione transport system substrate-binding protein
MKRGSWFLVVAIIAIICLVAGCNGKTKEGEQSEASVVITDQGTVVTEGGTLRYGLSSEPSSIEPVKAVGTVQRVLKESIYRGLLGFDTKGKHTYELAKAIDVSDDNLTYTVKLRDAKFHNGDSVTAQDVAYTFNRILDKNSGASFRQELSVIKSIDVLDDKTVVFHLSEVCAPFMDYLALPESAIVSESFTKAHGGKLDAEALGAGPFKFVSWTKGQNMIVEKFSDYYKPGRPYLDKIEFVFFSDDDARSNALVTGEVDMIDYVAWKDIPTLQMDKSLKLDEAKGPVMILSFNTNTKPLNDARVRRAIGYAINRENVINMAFNGQGIPAYGFILPEGGIGYDASLNNYFSYDVEKAKQLLADAGYANGFSCTLLASSQYSMHQQTAISVQNDLKQIGINVTLDLPDWATRMSKVGDKEYDMFVNAMSGDYNDPDWLSNYIQSGIHTFNKSADFANQDIDRLLQEGRITLDPTGRDSIYKELSNVVLEQSPHVFINWRSQTTGMRVAIEGYASRPGNLVLTQAGLTLEDLHFKK